MSLNYDEENGYGLDLDFLAISYESPLSYPRRSGLFIIIK